MPLSATLQTAPVILIDGLLCRVWIFDKYKMEEKMALDKNEAEKYFPSTTVDVDDIQCSVARIDVGLVPSNVDPARLLAASMEFWAQFFGNGDSTTVWLNVTANRIPEFVTKAVNQFEGFGLGLVITFGDHCSHPPGQSLPEEILSAMARSQRHGQVWHPLANKRVESKTQEMYELYPVR